MWYHSSREIVAYCGHRILNRIMDAQLNVSLWLYQAFSVGLRAYRKCHWN